jgi:hypothetical protein
MKAISLAVICALVLFPLDSYAGCADYHNYGGPGPTYGCPNNYYSFDLTCANPASGVSSSTMSCYTWPGYSFTGTPGTAVYQMTVPTGHTSSCKVVRIYVDFTDNSGSLYDYLSANVTVIHNGSQQSSTTFFFHSGLDGSLECQLVDSSAFSAAEGDTIKVTYIGYNYYSDVMKVTPPLIWD